MWTSENRTRYDRAKLRYPSDLTDAVRRRLRHDFSNISANFLATSFDGNGSHSVSVSGGSKLAF